MLFNTRTYNLDRMNNPDSLQYAGALHVGAVKDLLTLARTYAKKVLNAIGVNKPLAKRTRTVTVNATTGEKADLIITLSGSVPEGTPAADIDAGLADMGAFATSDECKALFKSLDIHH